MARDYGSGLSNYLDPLERSFDTVVTQATKPVLDSELVLTQDIRNEDSWGRIRTTTPSGFLTGDFLDKAISDYDFRTEANTFHLINRPVVNVNGWVIPIEYTNTSTAGENQIVLDAPPSGSGTVAADFVFLEVWRALISPDPSTTNKPSANQIFRHGNVLSLAPEWLADDLIDPVFLAESTLRVQIQYRIRTVRLNSRDTRLGFDDPNVFAQGPNGAPTALAFAQDTNDPGLWVAGTGVPATTNSVDGFIYAIPICIAFRRNDTAWNFLSNGNGGSLIVSGTSTRPDGLYADEVVLNDILDLRSAVTFGSFDLHQLLEHNMSLLMDQELRANVTDNAHTGWYTAGDNVGSRYVKGDDIIPSFPATDPPSGNTVRASDGICKVFTDRPHIQEHVEVFTPPGGTWNAGDTVTLDFTANSPLGVPLANEQPAGTVILDVREARLDDTDTSTGYLPVPIASVSGLGTQTVVITFGTFPIGGSVRDVWVTYDISYPSGSGLSSHVTEAASNFSFLVHNPSAYNAAIGAVFTDDDAGRAAIAPYFTTAFEAPHRELTMTHTTDSFVTLSVRAASTTSVVLPEYINGGLAGVVQVRDSGTTPHTVLGVTGRTINIDPLDPLPTGDDLVSVDYFPERPLPVNGASHTIYYRTAALQAQAFEFLPAMLTVSPVYAPSYVYTGTASSGSVLETYPFPAALQQIPVHGSALYDGEDEFNAPGEIAVTEFSTSAGVLQLPVLVPLAFSEPVTYRDPLNVGVENQEFIDHYRTVDSLDYKPGIFAQNLSSIVEHKTFYSYLARMEQDTSFARQGSLVMVVVSQHNQASKENKIAVSDVALDGAACVAVYKLKGNPLMFSI